MVTLVLSLFVGSAMLVALTDTCAGLGTWAGAVYRPEEEIVPTVAVPPATPFTSQVTFLLLSARDRGCELLGLGDGERNRGRIDRDGNLRTCYRRLLRVAPATPYRENAKECRQSQQTRLQRLHTTPHSSWIDRM